MPTLEVVKELLSAEDATIVVFVRIQRCGEMELTQIADAHGSAPFFTRGAERGQEEPREEGEDRRGDQEFDKTEPAVAARREAALESAWVFVKRILRGKPSNF